MVRDRDFIDIFLSPVRAGFEPRLIVLGMNFSLNPSSETPVRAGFEPRLIVFGMNFSLNPPLRMLDF
ncbi:hypothetical protein [Scytonema millei]|uniref:hypothetical protein n=1 Tax=Scytonema millei TaxID=1245922 RepID=UPI001049BFAC|nr:hypothetical protein [Scytonema millei]